MKSLAQELHWTKRTIPEQSQKAPVQPKKPLKTPEQESGVIVQPRQKPLCAQNRSPQKNSTAITSQEPTLIILQSQSIRSQHGGCFEGEAVFYHRIGVDQTMRGAYLILYMWAEMLSEIEIFRL
jgi:hypothetical protein